jgi:hypothetical protein
VTDDQDFGVWLVEQGALSREDARRAVNAQRGRMGRLDTELIDLKLLTESRTLELLGKYRKTRTVSGSELAYASPDAVRMITPRIAARLGVVPFKIEGRTLSVATLDPGDLLIEDEIAQLTGCMISSFVTLEIRFVEALNRYYQAPITARYAGLLRRLSGVSDSRRPSLGVTGREPAAPARSTRSDKPTPSPSQRRLIRPGDDEDILEISADELVLFPSLRSDEGVEQPTGDTARLRAVEREVRRPPEPPPPSDSIVVPPETTEIGPEALLRAAAHAMQNVEMRDDIADAMLGFAAPLFRRRAMLVKRQDRIMGWRGEGNGVDEAAVRAVSIPVDEPSVFSGLLSGVEFWLGPLPAMPHNSTLTLALGGDPPKDCYVLPVRVRDRTVCFLYGDNRDDGVGGLPLAELKRLAAKAGLGFQVYLIKGKIRTI